MQSKNNYIKSLSLIIFILIVAISCGNNPTNPIDNGKYHKNYELLIAKWVGFEYKDVYEYNGNNYISYYLEKPNYIVNIEKIIWTTDDSGYMYGKYTKNDNDSSSVGLYYAVSFKFLRKYVCYLAGAWKTGGKNGTDTLEEAISEFTIENGYFSTYSVCEKSE